MEIFFDLSFQFFMMLIKEKMINALKNFIKSVLIGHQHVPISVLYQSVNLLIINKNFDLVLNDNNPKRISVAKLLDCQFPELRNPRLGHGWYFPHRLDYSTSGVVVIPLNKVTCRSVSKLFTDKKITKYYLALVNGYLDKIHFNLNYCLTTCVEDPTCHRMRVATFEDKNSLMAETRVLLLQHGTFKGRPSSKVLLRPITGRRHQLRVHLKESGHTIVGDYTYSNREDTEPYRMFLHAIRLVLPLPGEPLDVCTENPFLDPEFVKDWRAKKTFYDLEPSTYYILDT